MIINLKYLETVFLFIVIFKLPFYSFNIMALLSCFLTEVNTSGLEFSSATSHYRKIVGSENVFSHYASRCSGELSLLERLQTVLLLGELKCSF